MCDERYCQGNNTIYGIEDTTIYGANVGAIMLKVGIVGGNIAATWAIDTWEVNTGLTMINVLNGVCSLSTGV